MPNLITIIASDSIFDLSFDWLCKRREKLSHNNDVWDLRRNREHIIPKLQLALLKGEYIFSPQSEVRLPEGNLECWCACDSIVLKAMAIVLGEYLKPELAPSCVHIAAMEE